MFTSMGASTRQASRGPSKVKGDWLALQEGGYQTMDLRRGGLCVKKGSSDVTMSSSDWGPCAKASHQSTAVDQRAVACTAMPMIFCRGLELA